MPARRGQRSRVIHNIIVIDIQLSEEDLKVTECRNPSFFWHILADIYPHPSSFSGAVQIGHYTIASHGVSLIYVGYTIQYFSHFCKMGVLVMLFVEGTAASTVSFASHDASSHTHTPQDALETQAQSTAKCGHAGVTNICKCKYL